MAPAGMPGVSCHDRPVTAGRNLLQICADSGRTDLVLDAPIQKMVRELMEGKMFFLQYAITCGTCSDCRVATYPHTYAIPGTSFGQRLRAAITSYKNEAVSVKGTIRLIRDMFGVYLSA